MDPTTQSYAVFLGLAGATSALVLSGTGAAYATARSCRGIVEASRIKTEEEATLLGNMNEGFSRTASSIGKKSLVPVIMAGVLAIYGLIYAVISSTAGMFYKKKPSLLSLT